MAWKHELDDDATPLQRRMVEVMAEKNLTQRAWSLQAGLSPALVGQLVRGDIKGKSSFDTFEKLARAANVRALWLAEGAGDKYPATAESRVERPSRYGNLDSVIDYWEKKRPGRWSAAAIDAVRATANHEPEDLPVDHWETRLDAMSAHLAGRISLPDEADSPIPPRAKRRG